MDWSAARVRDLPIFVVSTTNRPDRLDRALVRLGRFGVKPAIFQSHKLNSGILGVALGHLIVAQFASYAGYEHLLVFEDDAIITDDAFDVLAGALNDLSLNEWSRLLLGGSFAEPEKIERHGSNLLWTGKPTSQTHGYLLSKVGIRWQFEALSLYLNSIYNKLEEQTHAFDVPLGNLMRHPCGDYQVDPIVSIQEDGFSEVSNVAFNKTADYFREGMPWAGKLSEFATRIPKSDLKFIDGYESFS